MMAALDNDTKNALKNSKIEDFKPEKDRQIYLKETEENEYEGGVDDSSTNLN